MAVTDVTPRRIGPYEVQGLLGEGGIGQVYAAQDTLLGRQVAIQILPGQEHAIEDWGRIRRAFA